MDHILSDQNVQLARQDQQSQQQQQQQQQQHEPETTADELGAADRFALQRALLVGGIAGVAGLGLTAQPA